MKIQNSYTWFFASILLLIYPACKQESEHNKKVTKTKEEPQLIQLEKRIINDQTYDLVKLNNQYWTATNMDIEVKDSWCYNGDAQCPVKGKLYRWNAANEACTLLGEGWRVPGLDDWKSLASAFGGYYDYLADEATGDARISNDALVVKRSSGLNFPLAGWRGSKGGFENQAQVGYYWTGSQKDEIDAWSIVFYPEGGRLTIRPADKELAFSCRCLLSVD